MSQVEKKPPDSPTTQAQASAARGDVREETPETLTGLRVTPAQKSAAGLSAAVVSLRHVWGEMGVVRGTRALLALNQDGGFDCMSCAWADPDGPRHTLEFCENGAKALAWEGDTDRVG